MSQGCQVLGHHVCLPFATPTGLPDIPFDFLELDPDLALFPAFEQDEPVGFLNPANTADLTMHHSMTGFVIFQCCAAVAQPTAVTSRCHFD